MIPLTEATRRDLLMVGLQKHGVEAITKDTTDEHLWTLLQILATTRVAPPTAAARFRVVSFQLISYLKIWTNQHPSNAFTEAYVEALHHLAAKLPSDVVHPGKLDFAGQINNLGDLVKELAPRNATAVEQEAYTAWKRLNNLLAVKLPGMVKTVPVTPWKRKLVNALKWFIRYEE